MAAVVAASAVWIVVSRRLPVLHLPKPSMPSLWVWPAAVVAALVAGFVSSGLLGVPLAALVVALFAAAVPFNVDAGRRAREREAVAEAWPDLLALMKGRISAGSTLPDAFIDAARSSPEPLRSAARPVEEAVMFGDGFAAALGRLRDRLDDATSDRVLGTLVFAHRSGGSRVGSVVSSLGSSISDELRLRKAHTAALTEQRMTALVALAAPWALLALTVATNPQAADAYRTAGGSVVIGVGFVSTAVGFLAARHTARLSHAPRVLR